MTWAPGAAVVVALAVSVGVAGLAAPQGVPSSARSLVPYSSPLLVNASAARAAPSCFTGAVTLDLWANVTGGVPPYAALWSFADGSHATGLIVSQHFSTWYPGNNATVNVTDSAGHTAFGVANVTLLVSPCPSRAQQPVLAVGVATGFVAVVLGAGALVAVLALARRRRRAPPTPPAP